MTKEQLADSRDYALMNYRGHKPVWRATLADGSDLRVYQRRNGSNVAGSFYLIAFLGHAGKPAAHHRYRQAEAAIAEGRALEAGRAGHAERRQATQRERDGFKTTLQVGAVLVHSWGYDQTNIGYYQVVAVSSSRRSVTIRKIAAKSVDDGWMQGTRTPLADSFTGPPLVKRVGPGESVKVREWGSWAHPWTGQPDRWSSYA